MKAFFYIWCFMAAAGFVASFFNPGHFYFTCIPSVLMAFTLYPEAKEETKS